MLKTVVTIGGGGGGGNGTVTSVTAGTGLDGGTITTSGTISLANTAVSAGTYGSNGAVSQVTIDAQGRITGASNVGITLPVANVTNAVSDSTYVLASGLLTGGGQLNANVTVSLTDVPIANVTGGVANTVNVLAGTGLTGGGALTGNVTLDLANTAVTPGVYGSATEVGQVTIDAQGRITNAANVTIAISTANVSGLGTMATQNANNVNITGGTADMLTLSNANISGSTANTAAMPDPSLPLNPEGYITISINGSNKKVPYYGV